jgi:pyruvate ferredoxin oxidoreductase alpha subunit
MEGAETVVIALGSVLGTIKDTVDEMRDDGLKVGVLGITSFRPFPLAAIREAVKNVQRIVVLEKSLAVGIGGIVATNVRMATDGLPIKVRTVIAGLGGRAITKASLHRVIRQVMHDQIEPVHFLDLDISIVNRVLERERQTRRTGPIAENILRELGGVAAKFG